MLIINTLPVAAKIKEIVQENEQVKTFILDISLGAQPGQFVMVWIPRLNEKPFSVAMDNGKELHLAIADVGPFSHALHQLKAGDQVGVRGPFGTEFTCKKNQHLAFLGGGYGAAPLYFFAHKAVAMGCQVEFVVGARHKNLLLYTKKIAALKGVQLHVATNDGSEGFEGFNTVLLEKVLTDAKTAGEPIDCISTCGPEIMMVKAAELAQREKMDAQISVERYMKCGFGVCGNCCTDGSGVPSCLQGPVMPLSEVLQLRDFGKYHRDHLGKKQYFNF